MEAPTSNSLDVFSKTDTDIFKKMEDELLRLQRHTRTIEKDRERAIGIHPQFRRKNKQVVGLKKQYRFYRHDIKTATSGANRKKDRKYKAALYKAILWRVQTTRQCDAGITLMCQLEALLRNNKREMLELKKTVGKKIGMLNDRRSRSEQRLTSTENRLETANLRFNIIQSENRKIREEIECMLHDRTNFNQCWSKMLSTLKKGKKFLMDLFESSTLAYDQRDEWCAKLKAITEKGKIDQTLHLQEMRELQKSLYNETKLYGFLAKKGMIRINTSQMKKEEIQKKKRLEEWENEMKAHLQLLDEIYNFTEETSINAISRKFKKKEMENHSLYKLLTYYCTEYVLLRRDLDFTLLMIEERQQWNERQDEERQNRIEELEKQLVKKRRINQELRQRNEKQRQVLNKVLEGIHDIFRKLNCSLHPYQALLGDKEPSLQTLNVTLIAITEEILEALYCVCYYERHVQKKAEKIRGSSSRLKKYIVNPHYTGLWEATPITTLVRTDPCPACIESRWLSRISDLPEVVFDRKMAFKAIQNLAEEPLYVRSDRIHPLTDCRAPSSRALLTKRYESS